MDFAGAYPPQANVLAKRLNAAAITDTNETAANVTITPQSYANFDPTAAFTLPAHSMTVLQWMSDGSPP